MCDTGTTQSVILRTNGNTRLSINSSGSVNIAGNLTISGVIQSPATSLIGVSIANIQTLGNLSVLNVAGNSLTHGTLNIGDFSSNGQCLGNSVIRQFNVLQKNII